MTGPTDDLLEFIRASFRSVWALELLLLVKQQPRTWSPEELIKTLRASELVVNKAIGELIAAGLLGAEGDGVRFMPVSDEIACHVGEVEKIYLARPDAVRRVIVSAAASGATAFADAFKLRKD